jgi:uncharacterized protein YbbC (DUF1343 family)
MGFRIACLLSFVFVSLTSAATIRLGIDELSRDQFKPLAGKKIGLVCHPASVNADFISTIEVLRKSEEVKLVALFGPEHGVYGDEYAGVKVDDRVDQFTGLKVFSLYGKNRKPSPEMLNNIDALVFDLQDIGSRSYTFISSMKLCLEACAQQGIEFVVLDRPNPIGGERIEGPMVEKEFESYVSALPIPYVHGMTMGELALLVRDQVAPTYDKLQVVKMSGWRRSMMWQDTELRWVPTSPHIPYASSCASYATTGILGELGQVSVGVGYPLPFDLIGAPWLKARSLAGTLNTFWESPREAYQWLSGESDKEPLPTIAPKGIQFREARFKPFYAIYKDLGNEGVQIYANPREADTLIEINFRILKAIDAPKMFKQANSDQTSMFDKVCGSSEPRKWLTEGRDLSLLFQKWRESCEKFRKDREKFLLY